MTAKRQHRPSLLLKWRSFLPGRTTDGNGFTCPRHCHLAVARPALSTAIENRACESRPPGPLEARGDEERLPCAASSTIPSEFLAKFSIRPTDLFPTPGRGKFVFAWFYLPFTITISGRSAANT